MDYIFNMGNQLNKRPKQTYDFDLEEIKKMRCYNCKKIPVKYYCSMNENWICDGPKCGEYYLTKDPDNTHRINEAKLIYKKKQRNFFCNLKIGYCALKA